MIKFFSKCLVISWFILPVFAEAKTTPLKRETQEAQKSKESLTKETLIREEDSSKPGEPKSSNDTKTKNAENLFHFQVGAGITLIPVRGVGYVHLNLGSIFGERGYYQGGFQGNVFFRVHPRVTVGLGLGYLISGVRSIDGDLRQEFNLTAGVRVYLRALPKEIAKPLFIMPYLSGGPQFSALFPDVRIQVGSENNRSEVSYHLFSLGAFLGAGAEFWINSHISLHAEAQFLFEGIIDKERYVGTMYGKARLGGQMNMGVVWYF